MGQAYRKKLGVLSPGVIFVWLSVYHIGHLNFTYLMIYLIKKKPIYK